MSDWRLIEQPLLPPYGCIACPRKAGAMGPVVDTLWDIPLAPRGGRVYICRDCALQIARVHGFSRGKKQTQLLEAAQLVDTIRQQIADKQTQLEEQREQQAALCKERDGLLAELELERGKVAQLEQSIARARQDMEANLAAVGGGGDA